MGRNARKRRMYCILLLVNLCDGEGVGEGGLGALDGSCILGISSTSLFIHPRYFFGGISAAVNDPI